VKAAKRPVYILAARDTENLHEAVKRLATVSHAPEEGLLFSLDDNRTVEE
jgi:hypothetical protein